MTYLLIHTAYAKSSNWLT